MPGDSCVLVEELLENLAVLKEQLIELKLIVSLACSIRRLL